MNHKWSERYRQIPADRREKIEAEVSQLLYELPLHELRRARRLSQVQLAENLGEKQSSISKLEQRTDMYVSTLRRYLGAMGGELIIAVRFPAGVIEINAFGEIAGSHPRPAKVASGEAPTSYTRTVRDRDDVSRPQELAKGSKSTQVIGLKLGRTTETVQGKAGDKEIFVKPTKRAPSNRKEK